MDQKVFELIKKSHHIVIVSHVNPDGDTLGSMIGLGEALKAEGKKITYINTQNELPLRFDFLASYDKIRSCLPKKYDLLISVDAASFDRTGLDDGVEVDISFDHHKSNTNFAKYPITDASMVSTSLVVYNFFKKFSIKITKSSATALYSALAEDSGFFKFDRVNQDTFLIAANLVKLGADPTFIADKLTKRNSLAKLRITEIYLRKLELKADAKVAFAKITLEDFEKSGALKSDTDTLVNLGLSLATVVVSIFAYEIDDRKIKVSLRSKSDHIDCSQIATKLGGGGHKRAAGFTADIKEIDGIIAGIIKETIK